MKIEYVVTERRGNGYIARIRKPILTDEERRVREEAVKEAMVLVWQERYERGAI